MDEALQTTSHNNGLLHAHGGSTGRRPLPPAHQLQMVGSRRVWEGQQVPLVGQIQDLGAGNAVRRDLARQLHGQLHQAAGPGGQGHSGGAESAWRLHPPIPAAAHPSTSRLGSSPPAAPCLTSNSRPPGGGQSWAGSGPRDRSWLTSTMRSRLRLMASAERLAMASHTSATEVAEKWMGPGGARAGEEGGVGGEGRVRADHW
jgi:hypothetical protein